MMVSLDTLPSEHAESLLRRIRSEFIEMPGMQLTGRQAARLWGMDPRTSEHLLEHLVCVGFLKRTRELRYRRPSG